MKKFNTIIVALAVFSCLSLFSVSGADAQAVVKARPLQVFSPGGGTVTVQAPAAGTANYNLTLPNVAPANGQTLQSDVNGGLSWVTPSSGGGGGTGGLGLYDNNNVKLGTVLYFNYGGSVNIITSNGYIVNVLLQPNGTDDFPVDQIYWSGNSCTGNAYLNDGQGGNAPFTGSIAYSKILAYSHSGASLYTLSSPDANGVSTSVVFTGTGYLENPTCMNGYPTKESGWALTAITNVNAGLPATIAYPLKIQ